MIRTGNLFANKAVVSPVSFRDARNGGVWQTIKLPDGSEVACLSRDVHERALARAKSVLAGR